MPIRFGFETLRTLIPRPVRRASPVLALALAAFGCSNKSTFVAPIVLPPLDSVRVSPKSASLSVGQSRQFTAVAYDTLGQAVAGASFNWTSGDPTLFAVTTSGRVTGRSEGSDTLFVEAGGKRDTALVSIGPAASGWFVETTNVSDNLNGVHFLADGRRGWVVGDAGAILHTVDAGANWSVMRPTTANLNAVWFPSETVGFAVGAGGRVLRTLDGGNNWTTSTPTSDNLTDVWFATPDSGWAVGGNGAILRTFDGGDNWTLQRPTGFTLQSVSFAGTKDGWAVGDGGVIVGTHDRGDTWAVLSPSITSQSLHGVWRLTNAEAWAAGLSGVAPRTIGPDTWELRNIGLNNQLESVCFVSSTTGWMAGFNSAGVVYRTDDAGLTWNIQSSNSLLRLNDVFFLDTMRGWSVGQGGRVVHTGTGGQ